MNSTDAAVNVGDKRQQRTIVNCFRDRTPSYYNRSHNRSGVRDYGSTRPEAQVFCDQTKWPPRAQAKIALLKSSSTKDLSRIMDGRAPLCDGSCSAKIQELNKQIAFLEKKCDDNLSYTNDLECKIVELTNKLEDLNNESKVVAARTKKSVRKKQTSATSSSVQPSKFVAWMNLSNLWKHRPSIETLKRQNIYNDEPCFDTEIEMVLKHEVHKTVPKIVVDCCDLIEEKFRKSPHPVEGLYRSCGDYNQIQTLRFSIDANDYDSLQQVGDIHTLTGVLKLFLREIKSPLVKATEMKTFIGQPNQWLLTPQPKKIQILQRLITSLPEINRNTLEYLFSHFHRITKVPLQSISADTLSISITPSIFHTIQGNCQMQDIHVLLKESETLADCVKIMIEYHSKIFESTAQQRQRQRRVSVKSFRRTLSHPSLVFQSMF